MGNKVNDVIFIEDEEVENTFNHDDSDVQDEVELQYEENFWRKEDDEPTG